MVKRIWNRYFLPMYNIDCITILAFVLSISFNYKLNDLKMNLYAVIAYVKSAKGHFQMSVFNFNNFI